MIIEESEEEMTLDEDQPYPYYGQPEHSVISP